MAEESTALPGEDAGSEGFRVAIAAILALVALLGAIASCGLSISYDDAGDADAAGVTALIKYSEARSGSTLRALENYRAYAEFLRQRALAEAVRAEMANPDSRSQPVTLERELREAESSALTLLPSISRYLNPNVGSGYDVERDIGEDIAIQSQKKDFGFDDYFAEADSLREKGGRLLRLPLILAGSVLLLTVAEGARSFRSRVFFAAIALVIAVASLSLMLVG